MASPHHIEIGGRRRPFVGWVWLGCAAAAATAMFALWPKDLPVLGGPMIMAFFIVPVLLYRTGHRHFVPSAKSVESRDPRPPILYLRSFRDEPGMRPHEEALSRLLSDAGPFVAIGDPRDTSPQLAAARDYVPDDAWQDLVLSRLKRARLVILLAGATPGLAWEVAQCRALLDPSRLVVIVPNDEGVYAVFARMCHEHGISLNSFDAFDRGDGKIAGLITFDAQWRACPQRFATVAVLDASFLHQNEEASWHRILSAVQPAGITPKDDLFAADLRGHWRLLPLAAIVVVAVQLIKRGAVVGLAG